jgi:hypothetical protein
MTEKIGYFGSLLFQVFTISDEEQSTPSLWYLEPGAIKDQIG